MARRAITAKELKTVGPYSPAIRAGPFLFISGQIPLDPRTGELISGPTEAQVRRCMENMKAILAAAGASLTDLVKVTIFLTDMREFDVVNRIYGEFFDLEPPARSCVQVAALPRGAKIEIEAVAYLEP